MSKFTRARTAYVAISNWWKNFTWPWKKSKAPKIRTPTHTSANVTGTFNSHFVGKMTGVIVDVVGFGLISIGYLIAGIWGSAVIAAIYFGIRLGTGFRVIQKQDFLVIERFGKFHRIAHDGPRLFLFLGIIDKIKLADTLAYQSFTVYNGDKAAELDFKDASAPVHANVWYAVANATDKKKSNWGKINAAIYAYTYAYGDPKSRIKEVVDGFMRPVLQSMSLDEAQMEKTSSGSDSPSVQLLKDKIVRKAMKTLGCEFDPSKPFVLSDIDIPAPLQEARANRLIAKAMADADAETGRGIREAIKAIKSEMPSITDDKAIETFINRVGLKTIENLNGANFQLIASDVGGVVRTLGVGPKNGVQQP